MLGVWALIVGGERGRICKPDAAKESEVNGMIAKKKEKKNLKRRIKTNVVVFFGNKKKNALHYTGAPCIVLPASKKSQLFDFMLTKSTLVGSTDASHKG